METRDRTSDRHSISYPLKPLQLCFTQVPRDMVDSCTTACGLMTTPRPGQGLPSHGAVWLVGTFKLEASLSTEESSVSVSRHVLPGPSWPQSHLCLLDFHPCGDRHRGVGPCVPGPLIPTLSARQPTGQSSLRLSQMEISRKADA